MLPLVGTSHAPSQIKQRGIPMRKLFNFIPYIYDIQFDPRLEGEPMFFTDRQVTQSWGYLILRIGPFKLFLEHVKR